MMFLQLCTSRTSDKEGICWLINSLRELYSASRDTSSSRSQPALSSA
jgi:hypothetical protein